MGFSLAPLRATNVAALECSHFRNLAFLRRDVLGQMAGPIYQKLVYAQNSGLSLFQMCYCFAQTHTAVAGCGLRPRFSRQLDG